VNLRGFLKSKWYRKAAEPGSAEYVREGFGEKLRKVAGNVDVASAAKKLYGYFTDPSVAAAKKLLIVAGLIYFINPFDMMPDLIPVLGYVDDLGILTMILAYLSREVSKHAASRTPVTGEEMPASAQPAGNGSRAQPAAPSEIILPGEEPPKRSWQARLVGFFVDDYVKEIEQKFTAKTEEETQRFVKSRLRVIMYSLIGVIVAASISLLYWYLKTHS